MSLITTIGIVLGAMAALVSVVVCVAFPMACKALERHLATPQPNFREDETGSQLWRERRWALDKYRLRVAMLGIGTYGVGMMVVTFMLAGLKSDGQSHPYVFACMMVTTASLLILSARAAIHNSRVSDLDMRRQYPDLYRNL
jgi:hypothetical protein